MSILKTKPPKAEATPKTDATPKAEAPSNISPMSPFVVRTTADQLTKQAARMRFATVLIAITTTMLCACYALSTFIDLAQDFTVDIMGDDAKKVISLSETIDFSAPTTSLGAEKVVDMSNITRTWLPDDIDQYEGSHNGEHYLAYSFYLKNQSLVAIDYTVRIDIISVTKDVDAASRVMVICNDVTTVYAKSPDTDEPLEDDTQLFSGNTVVMNELREDLPSGEIDKYTVVVWLEGNDPECVDAIKGGMMDLAMYFSVEQ